MKSAMRQKGFTLLEMLMTITVAGILLGLAVPTLGNVTRAVRLSGGSREFIVDFALARNEAVLRATNVSVCTSTNLTSCTNSGWGSGRLIFVDGGVLGAVDGGDQIISVTRTLNSSLTTAATGVAAANVITYSALGRTAGVGQITVCATGQTRRDINLRASGSATLDRTAIAC
jgi:type IV fimbrial biogenesis protein FimT